MAKAENVSSARYETQMRGLRKQLGNFGTGNQGSIEQDLMSRVDAFRPQYQELAGLESGAYSAPARLMQQYQQNYGNVGGPSSLSRLSGVLGNIGQQYGTANALSNVIDTQRGRIGDLAGMAMGQVQSERQAIQDQYGMYAPLQQQAAAREEAARQRAFQAKESARARAAAASNAARARAASRAASTANLNPFPTSQSSGGLPPAPQVPTRSAPRSLQGGGNIGGMLQGPGSGGYQLRVR